MRKLFLLAALTIGMVASSVAQMAIPGEVFASNPARFNGRKVTLKNIEIVKDVQSSTNSVIAPGPAINLQAAPGAIGTPTAPNVTPCRPPRGFSEVSIFFKADPDYKGCFFMANSMKAQLDRETGHENTPAQITFRGDYRTGYNVTFYRLGQ